MKKNVKMIILGAVCVVLAMGCEYLILNHNEKQVVKTITEQNKKAVKQVVIESHDPDNWWRDYCESNITIVDWNVGSDEMAFQLSDGTELYATKTENIYTPKFRQYVAFDEIQDMSKADDGTITIVTTDGNSYTVNPSVKVTEQGTRIK